MKKMKYFLILLIPIFFMLLSGCSKLSIKTTSNSYKADGLVAVIKGKATKASDLTYTMNGTTKKVKMNDGHFVISVPVASTEQDVKLVASNGSTNQTKIVTVNAANPLGDYTNFAQQYNYQALLSGAQNDQLPLVAEDGIFNYRRPDNTMMYINAQNDYLMGISIKTNYKDLKTKTGQKKFGLNLAMVAQMVGANPKQVVKKVAGQFKNMNSGDRSNTKRVTSNGVNFDIGLADKAFYVYVTK